MSDLIRLSLSADFRAQIRRTLPGLTDSDLMDLEVLMVRDCLVTDDGAPHPALVAWVQAILARRGGAAGVMADVPPKPVPGEAGAQVVTGIGCGVIQATDKQTARALILDAAREAVTRDRAATHGDAEANFARIAAVWSVRLGVTITPAQVALMLVDLKVTRAWGNPAHQDNWVDIAGYAACGGEIAGWVK